MIKTIIILALAVMIQSCASTGHNQPSPYQASHNKPISATVQVYVPQYTLDEYFLIDYVNQQQLTINSGKDIQAAAMDVSQHYFSDVSALSFDKPADYILKIRAESSLNNDARPLMTANLVAQLLNLDGDIVYESTIVREQSKRDLDEHAYYGLYAKAVDEFLKELFLAKRDNLQHYLHNNQSRRPVMNTKMTSNILEVSSTGTGFFVNGNGDMITNHHVIEQCLAVSVDLNGQTIGSKIINSNPDIDVAILSTNNKGGKFALFNHNQSGERLGQSVMAIGYPLYGVLSSSINLTTGNISSLLGVKNDDNVYQISTPIQPGNSGGPVLNRRGLVAGIVQSKLNALELSQFTGDLAQNVNFAVKSEKVKSFLSENGISYHTRSYSQQLDRSTVDIAEHAKQFTVQIKCHG